MRLVAKSMVAIAATVVIAACSSTGQNNVVVSKERYMAPVAKEKSAAQVVASVEPVLSPAATAPVTSQAASAAKPMPAAATTTPVVVTTASIQPPEPKPTPEDILPVPVEGRVDDGQQVAASPETSEGKAPEKAEQPYLELTHYSAARVRYDEATGLVAFDSFEGSLNDNVRALLAATVGAQLVTAVSDNHRLVGDYTITGKTVLEILDRMLVPFSAPHQIVATAYINNVVKVTYQSNEEPQ